MSLEEKPRRLPTTAFKSVPSYIQFRMYNDSDKSKHE